MKKVGLSLLMALFLGSNLNAQSADEVIDGYFEAIGGKKAMRALTGIQMKASVNQGGMEIPINVIQLKDGKQLISINLQGKEIVQSAYDGEVLWNTNFQTMKAEKSDSESLQMMQEETKDFPDALLDYKKKGYRAELIEGETIEGVECFKLKLTKNPLTIEGEEVENVDYYYFDKESYVLIAQEKEVLMGPQKGVVGFNTFSDYQEVDGLYFAFSMNRGIKGGGSQPLVIKEIILNPEVDESLFSFPVELEEVEETTE